MKKLSSKFVKISHSAEVAPPPDEPCINAFTLAEVLITLGIIGIIAAMTLPALITKHEKITTVNKLKHSYTTLGQAIKLSENDNGPMSEWEWKQDSNTFQRYIAPYLKATLIRENDHIINNIDGKPLGLAGDWYYTPSGESYLAMPTGYYFWLFVDLNGKNGPNRFGRDIFGYTLYSYDLSKAELRFTGSGYNRTYIINNDYTCKKGSNALYAGSQCGALIQYDGWQITDTYPW